MTHRKPGKRPAAAATVAAAVVGSALMVWNASSAAFSDSTQNSGNTWSSGTVAITGDHTGSAVFSLAAVKPDAASSTLSPPHAGPFAGSSAATGGSACVKVSYTGTLPADVRLYASLSNTGADGGLGQYLLFDVDTGTGPAGGTDVTCAGYTSGGYLHGSAANSTVYLSSLPSTYAAGLAGWTGATTGTSVWYRLSWLLPANTPNAAQLESTTATFTWEAQNS